MVCAYPFDLLMARGEIVLLASYIVYEALREARRATPARWLRWDVVFFSLVAGRAVLFVAADVMRLPPFVVHVVLVGMIPVMVGLVLWSFRSRSSRTRQTSGDRSPRAR